MYNNLNKRGKKWQKNELYDNCKNKNIRCVYGTQQFLIEIEENKRLTVDGVDKILEYQFDRIVLKSKKKKISVFGDKMIIKSMQNECVIICGEILKVEFSNCYDSSK